MSEQTGVPSWYTEVCRLSSAFRTGLSGKTLSLRGVERFALCIGLGSETEEQGGLVGGGSGSHHPVCAQELGPGAAYEDGFWVWTGSHWLLFRPIVLLALGGQDSSNSKARAGDGQWGTLPRGLGSRSKGSTRRALGAAVPEAALPGGALGRRGSPAVFEDEGLPSRPRARVLGASRSPGLHQESVWQTRNRLSAWAGRLRGGSHPEAQKGPRAVARSVGTLQAGGSCWLLGCRVRARRGSNKGPTVSSWKGDFWKGFTF